MLDDDAKTGNVNCLMLESFATDEVAGKTSCEEIGKGYCTPGATPCRVAGSDYPPISPYDAASQLNLPIRVTGSDGVTVDKRTPAHVEGRSVFLSANDGKKHLVCEVMQLAGGRVEPKVTNACVHDPAFEQYKDLAEIPKHTWREIQRFFEDYKILETKAVRVDGMLGAAQANEVIRTALRLYQEQENRLRGWG